MESELLLRYRGQSTVRDEGIDLVSSDAGMFFDGFAEHPLVTARALLCVAEVAATRFYVPKNLSQPRRQAGSGREFFRNHCDPVITSEPGHLRFESFSQCCGVHARFDLLPEGMDVRTSTSGTTNVDFSSATCEALAHLASREPLRLRVGTESVKLETLDSSVTELRIPLPERWVHGFGEVQVPASHAEPLLHLAGGTAQRFLRSLPRGRAGEQTYWTADSGATVRLMPRPTSGSVCVAAPKRLSVLDRVAAHALSLTAHGSPDTTEPSTVIWVVELPDSRISLTLSPDWKRGFTGEGAMLIDLASPSAPDDAQRVREHLADVARFSTRDAADTASLSAPRAIAALTWLGIHGELGHDTTEATWFWRRLPYPSDILASQPRRLRDARALAAQGAVEAITDNSFRVRSGNVEYRTEITPNAFRCTCPWSSRHGTSRGPCKHILASLIASHPPLRRANS